MTGFDAELYLRLLGERALLRGQAEPWETPLAGAAQALLAIGAVEDATAAEVLLDYEVAAELRTGEYEPRPGSGALGEDEPVRPLSRRRVVACDAELEGELHVRYVSLAEDETVVGVRFPPPHAGFPRIVGRHHVHAAWHPPHRDLTDDRGTTARAHFSGGGGMDEWVGRLIAMQPLATDTAWIELGGSRIELTRPAVAAEVAIEPLAEADPALRHLFRIALGAGAQPGEDAGFEPAVEALVAAGGLTRADPRLAPLRLALEGGHGGRLPEPWRSLRPAAGDGPPGTLTLDALTPEFDGISVAATVLESHESGFSLEVDVAPGSALAGSFGPPTSRARGLAWWATDDRGHRYVGGIGGFHGGDGHASGQVEFAPGLDPLATRLEIAAIADLQQALIRFPLEWP